VPAYYGPFSTESFARREREKVQKGKDEQAVELARLRTENERLAGLVEKGRAVVTAYDESPRKHGGIDPWWDNYEGKLNALRAALAEPQA
jgi:hypothetical protein